MTKVLIRCLCLAESAGTIRGDYSFEYEFSGNIIHCTWPAWTAAVELNRFQTEEIYSIESHLLLLTFMKYANEIYRIYNWIEEDEWILNCIKQWRTSGRLRLYQPGAFFRFDCPSGKSDWPGMVSRYKSVDSLAININFMIRRTIWISCIVESISLANNSTVYMLNGRINAIIPIPIYRMITPIWNRYDVGFSPIIIRLPEYCMKRSFLLGPRWLRRKMMATDLSDRSKWHWRYHCRSFSPKLDCRTY